jgi:hypothetical protein
MSGLSPELPRQLLQTHGGRFGWYHGCALEWENVIIVAEPRLFVPVPARRTGAASDAL